MILSVSNPYQEGVSEDYERFFERFYRGDTSHNSKKSGYGIGLSMARDMARLMKGSLDVSYKDGVITFSLSLQGFGETPPLRQPRILAPSIQKSLAAEGASQGFLSFEKMVKKLLRIKNGCPS